MNIVCGCCEPPVQPAPLAVENRPALPAVVYRIGTYATFRESMLLAVAGQHELAALTTRSVDDYAITILNLWAAVADVLTFYQERYANEAFLRTAQFRESILRLAGLIGYRLRPGIAARTLMGFTLDKDKRLSIPAGQKIQSVPEAGAQPQTFETLESVDADWRFNRLRIFPPPVLRNQLAAGRSFSILGNPGGTPGDNVVFFNNGTTDRIEEKKISSVNAIDDRQIVSWTAPINQTTWSASTFVFKSERVLRLFGHNAPEQTVAPHTPDPAIPSRIVWRLATLASVAVSGGNNYQLDSRYENLTAGRRLLIVDTGAGGQSTLVTVSNVAQASASLTYSAAGSTFDIPSTEPVSALEVHPILGGEVPAIANRRNVLIYELDGDPFVFATQDYPDSVTGDTVFVPGHAVFDTQGPGIQTTDFTLHLIEVEKGRTVLLGDNTTLLSATIKDVPHLVPPSAKPGQNCHLAIPLSIPGTLSLDTASAFLLGNVAPASHGESVLNEIAGSGDASAQFQRVTLRKSPLTWLPSGSTLRLYVDGIRWHETPQLFGQASNARVYELLTADDGATTVQFGDGGMGSVLPTGKNNIIANYRNGSGLAGRVAANSLTTLLQKPAGLASATNPQPAEGGADAETLAQARDNAPRTVRTFGRIVSLRDFEDQVTASGEVAKALATFIWDGLDRAVHLTIAGQDGGVFSDQARRELSDSLKLVRDANHRLRIANYAKVFIQIRAGIGIDPDFVADTVIKQARGRLLAYLDFDNLKLGQTVNVSDVFRVLQDTPGVLFVDVDLFLFKRPAGMTDAGFALYLASRGAEFLPLGTPIPVQGRLRMFTARQGQPGIVLPAELASIESPTQDVIIEVRS